MKWTECNYDLGNMQKIPYWFDTVGCNIVPAAFSNNEISMQHALIFQKLAGFCILYFNQISTNDPRMTQNDLIPSTMTGLTLKTRFNLSMIDQ